MRCGAPAVRCGAPAVRCGALAVQCGVLAVRFGARAVHSVTTHPFFSFLKLTWFPCCRRSKKAHLLTRHFATTVVSAGVTAKLNISRYFSTCFTIHCLPSHNTRILVLLLRTTYNTHALSVSPSFSHLRLALSPTSAHPHSTSFHKNRSTDRLLPVHGPFFHRSMDRVRGPAKNQSFDR